MSRAPVQARGAEDSEAASDTSVAHATTRAPDIEAYLRSHLRSISDQGVGVPLLHELTADDIGTPPCEAAIYRAALSHLLERSDEVIAARLREELAESDRLVIARLGSAHDDLRGDTDWVHVFEVATARREYRERWGVA